MAETRVLEIVEGRELAWLDIGPRDAPVVFGFHGSPGSRMQLYLPAVERDGPDVRLVLPDRPGYGHSTYQPRRTLAGWAADVATLADHLGVDRFAVLGVSGGGPHALACGAVLGPRVTSVGVVSGVGPVAEMDAATDGMNRAGTAMFGAARAGLRLNRPMVAAGQWAARRWPDRSLDAAARMAPPRDAAILRRPSLRAAYRRRVRLAGPTEPLAAAQDLDLFARPWGFRLADVAPPTIVWHGDADPTVPLSHGRFVADHVPGAELRVCRGEAHLLVADHLPDVLAALTA